MRTQGLRCVASVVMYRAATCTYGRVLAARHVTCLISPLVPLICTRGLAKAKPAKDAKEAKKKDGEPKVKKPRVKKTKTPVDETKPRLHLELNTPAKSDTPIPSITRQQLQELMKTEEKFLLVDLRTETEILLAGDALIPAAVRMPIQPLTHLNTYKPPKVKVDKTAKGKKAKKNPKHAAKKPGKPEPARVEPQQRDVFLSSYRMTPATWEAKYKFPKIDFEDNVVFLSSSNVRSTAVVNSAMKLGYKNVKILEGGSRLWNKYHNILGQ